MVRDPDNVSNLSGRPEYAATLRRLSADLMRFLRETGDPRATGREALWDRYTYHAPYLEQFLRSRAPLQARTLRMR